LNTGVDAAKAIALGADIAGFGRSLLAGAAASEDGRAGSETLYNQLERIEFELRTAMFGIGAATLSQLRDTDRLTMR
jgi:isopentenyl-diphosphate delta-isomerase